MAKLVTALLVLLAPSLAAADTPGKRAAMTVGIGLASGWGAGSFAGVGIYAGFQSLTAPPCDNDMCGLGNALRPLVLGVPTGVGLGTAAGAVAGHYAGGGDRLGVVALATGIPAVLGATGLLVGPLMQESRDAELLVYGGLVTNLLVVPLVAGATSASLTPRTDDVARSLHLQPMLGTTRGLRLAGTF